MLERLMRLRLLNPKITIHSVESKTFIPYGTVYRGFDLDPMVNVAKGLYRIESGTRYETSNVRLEELQVSRHIANDLFGELPIQVGCCYGFNTLLNGMEYHKSSEILGAVTDIVLIVGRLQDVDPDTGWDSRLAEIFYVPEDSLIELYGTTLHFAPCRVDQKQFTAVIILPKGTNDPLACDTEGTRWMKNKWLLAHPESPAAAKGAAVRITGKNLSVNPIVE